VCSSDLNRWTRGAQVLLARDWLAAQFAVLEGFTVITTSFPVTYSTGWNVIATLPGTTRPGDWYVVGGHYDSTSENPSVAAPGADDNASGCAGVLELARLFAAHPPDATMIFICFSGEEQYLYGSQDYVDDLSAAGDLGHVLGAYIIDMIAFSAGPPLEAILETESPVGLDFTNAFNDAALDFTTLGIVREYGVCCSDHAPFLWASRPAVLAIEADYPSNPNYHTTNDLPGYLTPALAGQILRMGGGGLLRLAGSSTIFVDGFESGGALRWSALVPAAP
jgi:Zn-dependent M28 family amino/carboxypeptidase